MVKCKKIFSAVFFVMMFSGVFTACASKPKRSMVVNTVATSCGTMLENANACISSGNYDKAEYFLDQAYRMAMSVDNSDLLVSVFLMRISTYLSESPAKLDFAKLELENAKRFVPTSHNVEKNSALCVLSEVRIALCDENPDYTDLLSRLEKVKSVVQKELYEFAQFNCLKGDIYKNQENYKESEKAYLAALEIFEKEKYLSEMGVNWYKVAQVRSLNGRKAEALAALENAIKFDRDSENSNALGTDYYVKGIILLKDNPSAAEKAEAKAVLLHSAEIFEAADLLDLAARSLEKMENL